MKNCSTCKELKVFAEFGLRGDGKGYKSQCRTCRHRNRNKSLDRDRGLRWRYGLSLSEYNSLLDKQGGVCAICRTTEDAQAYSRWGGMMGRIKNLSVDHDHKTKRVRGLLCQKCNQRLETPPVGKVLAYLESGEDPRPY